jgi:hypothetical protein
MAPGESGVTTVTIGPDHPDYAAYWPFPGVPVGLHEVKAIEVRNLFAAIANDAPPHPSFHDGWRVAEVLEAIERASIAGVWTAVPE